MPMQIAIYGRVVSSEYYPYIQQLFDKLYEQNAALQIVEPFVDNLLPAIEIKSDYSTFNTSEEIKKADFVFSIGGDGTILETITYVKDSEIPILGINTGRLGFLSSISINEIDNALEALQVKSYHLDKRTLLKLETNTKLFGDQNFALNEFTIHKKDSAAMIIVHAYLDGKFLNSYWADGLIISTSTGSTAYSLSCGGPILLPGNGNFVINPVAPHNLNVRPFVVPNDSKITLRVEGRSDSYLVSLDSRSETIYPNLDLHISKNDFNINIVRLQGHSYLDTLRTKLNWGFDTRGLNAKND